MLWVNGYTSDFFYKAGLTPKPGSRYWTGNYGLASQVLNDWQSIYIDPASGLFSSAKSRFHQGYVYASLFQSMLMKHIVLSGNHLNIIAHSHGVAFAEGIATYFFEEKGILTENLVAIQGAQMAKMPQTKNAVKNRIVLKTEGDVVVNKRNQSPRFCDAFVTEKLLKTGYCKYQFALPEFYEKRRNAPLYIKGGFTWRNAHCIHRYRKFQLWNAVGHAVKLLNEFGKEELQLTGELDRISSLITYYNNYN